MSQMPNNNIGLANIFRRFRMMTLEHQKQFVSFLLNLTWPFLVSRPLRRILKAFPERSGVNQGTLGATRACSLWRNSRIDKFSYKGTVRAIEWLAPLNPSNQLQLPLRTHFWPLLYPLRPLQRQGPRTPRREESWARFRSNRTIEKRLRPQRNKSLYLLRHWIRKFSGELWQATRAPHYREYAIQNSREPWEKRSASI